MKPKTMHDAWRKTLDTRLDLSLKGQKESNDATKALTTRSTWLKGENAMKAIDCTTNLKAKNLGCQKILAACTAWLIE